MGGALAGSIGHGSWLVAQHMPALEGCPWSQTHSLLPPCLFFTRRHQNATDFVLNVPEFTCSPGELVAVVGRVGAGKSSLIQVRRAPAACPPATRQLPAQLPAALVVAAAAGRSDGRGGLQLSCQVSLWVPTAADPRLPPPPPRPQAILGNMTIEEGQCQAGGKVAYVPQEAW